MASQLRLLGLPPELILACLAKLSYADLKTCFRIQNRLLRYILTNSVLIRYRFEEHSACVEENPAQTAYSATADLLEALRTREASWRNFTPRAKQTLAVDFATSGVHDLTSDIYLVGQTLDPNTRISTAIRYCYTSPGAEPPRWRSIQSGKPIVDFGSALEEHDLLALVTYAPHEHDPHTASVDVLLLQFSTGDPHPLAARPTIHLHDVEVDSDLPPGVSIEILGENLAISLVHWGEEQYVGSLQIYNWTSGVSKMTLPVFNNTGPIFLTPDILVIPHIDDFSLWVYHIPQSDYAGAPYVTHYFDLPMLSPDHGVMTLQCRGDPNRSTSCTRPSRSLFLPRADTALLLFTFRVVNREGHVTDHMFVVDRPRFLSMVAETDSTDSPIPHDWAEWGPRCTRWIEVAEPAAGFTRTTCGTRLVTIAHDAPLHPAPIRVLDFNEAHVRAQRAAGPTERVRVVEGDTDSDVEGTAVGASPPFAEPIVSLLPYVETTSAELFDYARVLVNDENILGVKFRQGRLKALDVLHFG